MQGIMEPSAQTSEPTLTKPAEPLVLAPTPVTHPDPGQAYSDIEEEAKRMTGKITGLFGM
jgi:hypothetical protein